MWPVRFLTRFLALVIMASAANAAPVVFDFSGSFTTGSSLAAFPPPYQAAGTLTIDPSLGQVLAADISLEGYSLHFTVIQSQGPGNGSSYYWVDLSRAGNSQHDDLILSIPTATTPASLVGFAGATLVGYTGVDGPYESSLDGGINVNDAAGGGQTNCFSVGGGCVLTSGALTAAAAATPVPATLLLFVGGLGAMCLLGWRRNR